ncbi:initiation factor, subunit 2 family protein [Besnoitia besnoiti]|uniref:Translation initiation factor eIF2B subunit delta n=1 Tax=Besnoitia besnoiti TaxID=94643 RepID=A0A2A9LZL6_BESBE|nr:initiation factor, subunit 2 family protein [Besnoitia besnoiti]PFH31179.1 initiation factor, subunit 2 family protein [Besnoitia besnoiti]
MLSLLRALAPPALSRSLLEGEGSRVYSLRETHSLGSSQSLKDEASASSRFPAAGCLPHARAAVGWSLACLALSPRTARGTRALAPCSVEPQRRLTLWSSLRLPRRETANRGAREDLRSSPAVARQPSPGDRLAPGGAMTLEGVVASAGAIGPAGAASALGGPPVSSPSPASGAPAPHCVSSVTPSHAKTVAGAQTRRKSEKGAGSAAGAALSPSAAAGKSPSFSGGSGNSPLLAGAAGTSRPHHHGPAAAPLPPSAAAGQGGPEGRRRKETNKASALASSNVQWHSHLRFLSHLPPYDRSVIPMCSFTVEGVPILKRPQGRRQKGGNEEVPLQTRIVMDFQQDLVHPAVIRVGLQMGRRRVTGTNARTVAMLTAFERFIEDYCPPPYEAVDKHLKIALDRQINFITHCRPHSLSMGGAIRWLKKRLSSYATMPLQDTKVALCSEISTFISQRILAATCAVANVFQEQLAEDGDCLLVYGKSTAVLRAIIQAKKRGRRFTVVVVDSHPHLAGQATARAFAAAGIEVTYTLLNGLSYHMEDVTKVVLGAAAVLANAAVVNRAGAAVAAMTGKRYAKPIFVLCESYKMFDRIVFDSCSFNELDDPELVWTTPTSYSSSAIARKAGEYDSLFAESTRQYPRMSLRASSANAPPGLSSPLIRAASFLSKPRKSQTAPAGVGGINGASNAVPAASPAAQPAAAGTLAGSASAKLLNGKVEVSLGAGGKPDGKHAGLLCGNAQSGSFFGAGGEEEPDVRPTSRVKAAKAASGAADAVGAASHGDESSSAGSEVCVMNLCYDVTPAQFVDFVVTEDGIYPASNVPALLVRGSGRAGGAVLD